MKHHEAGTCVIALACTLATACMATGEGEPSREATAITEQAARSGGCHCDVTVDVYDDSCGAACGYLGSTSFYKLRDPMGSTYACVQWCQQVAWNRGYQACQAYAPDSRSVVLDWSGRWGFDPYFFYNQQYACSDL
jgi:hypothetical protein